MKKVFSLVLCLLTLSITMAAHAEGNAKITLHYMMDGYADEIIETSIGTKVSKAIRNHDFQRVSRTPYGYDFDAWYYDEAFTETYGKQDKVSGDLELYAHWQPWEGERAALLHDWMAEMDICKTLLNDKPMYTEESFEPFMKYMNKTWSAIGNASRGNIEKMQRMRASLVPVCERDEVVWDIWGEQVPSEDTTGYSFYLLQDTEDFRPLLTVFMLKDQSQVKGNIIICSGGAFTYRGNSGEGYATAEHMNALGYNCYVLQYRLRPYDSLDAYLDLQRAIRYLRFHAEDKGIGAIENIATIGYSAGGFVVANQMATCYGDVQPSVFYPDYVPDEIDAMNSDVKVCAPIYSMNADLAKTILEGGNQHLPAMFIAVGNKDATVSCEGVVKGFLSLSKATDAELHVYDGAPHGFGMSDDYVGADQMDEQFDAFLMVHFGLTNRKAH